MLFGTDRSNTLLAKTVLLGKYLNVKEIRSILCILCSPPELSEKNTHNSVSTNLCKHFAERCMKKDINVDFLDLYNDHDFDAISPSSPKEGKVIEYQLRLKQADLIVFFHPVWWSMPPALLKGFIDKIFTPGFAYTYQQGMYNGLFEKVPLMVFTISDKPVWQQKFLYGNVLELFWHRVVGDRCGFTTWYYPFGGTRTMKSRTLETWKKKINSIVDSFNTASTSIIDLF